MGRLNESMLAVTRDYALNVGYFGTGCNGSVVEVASTTCADIIEEVLIDVILPPFVHPEDRLRRADFLHY